MRILVAALIAGSCLVPSAATADTLTRSHGGSGGSSFHTRCPMGQVLAGLSLQGNTGLRTIAPICGLATGPTKIDAASVAETAPRVGSVQAPFFTLSCVGDTPAVRALHVGTYHTAYIVDLVLVYCGPIASDAPAIHESDTLRPSAEWNGERGQEARDRLGTTELLPCEAGEVAVGIHGRSGASIDALGLICDNVVPTPKPLPSTETVTNVRVGPYLPAPGLPATQSPGEASQGPHLPQPSYGASQQITAGGMTSQAAAAALSTAPPAAPESAPPAAPDSAPPSAPNSGSMPPPAHEEAAQGTQPPAGEEPEAAPPREDRDGRPRKKRPRR